VKISVFCVNLRVLRVQRQLLKEVFMVETVTKLPVKTEGKPTAGVGHPWYAMDSLRREIDRLFADFDTGFSLFPFRRSFFDYVPTDRTNQPVNMLAVDIAENDAGYEIKAELPGVTEKDIEVKLVNGGLLITGEKKEEKEEKEKGYVLSECSYGSFERSFALPDSVDTNKISATFANGVLKVTLPKTHEAKLQERKITVKAA
jgi:HSP20 family protein